MGPDIGDFANGLVAEHVVSRSVRDTAAALDCTHGPEAGDPYFAPHVARPFFEEAQTPPGRLRIAFSAKQADGRALHPECGRAVESTAKLLEDLGHTVEEAMPPVDPGMIMNAFLTVFAAAHAAAIDGFAMLNGRVPKEEDFEGLTWAIYQHGKQTPATQYLLSISMLQIVSRQVGRFHETYDCWLTTTLGAPPIGLGTIDIHQRDALQGLAQLADYVPVTPLQNATGQPAISLPLHWTADGLPVGLMFSAALGGEGTLLRLAGQLEQARPWRQRKPPVWG
jgi:amidase